MVPKPSRISSTKEAAEESASEFGERMRIARRTRSLTLREVSEATGVSITYLSDLERGALTNPTLDKLIVIARVLEVPLAHLVGADDEAEPARSVISSALLELTRMPQFREAISLEAKRWRTTQPIVEQEWLRSLQGISVLGHRPSEAFDYLFVFEAARRAIEEP